MSNKKRLLIVTSTFPRWRGDKEPPFVFELTKRLAYHFEIVVLAPHAPGALRFELMDNIKVHRFYYCIPFLERLSYNGGILGNLKQNQLNYLLIPFFFVSEFFYLLYLTRKYRIEVIHSHWMIPQGLISVCVKLLSFSSKPILVCTSHGSDMFSLQGKIATRLKRLAARHIDAMTVVSKALRKYALELAPSPSLTVIPMGVDLIYLFKPSLVVTRSSSEILFVGRLVDIKGVRHLIQAMPNVVKLHPDARLTIVGDGPEKQQLVSLSKALGVMEQISFLGSLNSNALPEVYCRATMLVLPSLSEGLGLTIIEALGCECPVIASDLPTVKDVVIHDATGLLSEPGNFQALAKNIIYLLDHPQKRMSLAKAGRKHVIKRFDWQHVSQRYIKLIDNLVSQD